MDGNILADVLGGLYAVVGQPLPGSGPSRSTTTHSDPEATSNMSEAEAGPGPNSGLQGPVLAAAEALCSQLDSLLTTMQPDAISRALLGLVR
jgi:hypothetical protein